MALLAALKGIAIAAESAFSTAASSNYSGYTRVDAENVSWEPAEEYIARPVQTTSLGYHHAGAVGTKGGKLSFLIPVAGLGTAAASTVVAVPRAYLSKVLQSCGMTETLGTGTTVTGSGSTTTSIDCTSAAGIAVNTLVMINGEVRAVTAKSTNTITVAPALSAIPAATDVVYSSASYVLGDGDPGTATFVCKGDGYVYRFLGCKGTVKLKNVTAAGDGKRLMFEVSYEVNDWDHSEPSGTFPSLARPASLIAKASPFYWNGSARAVGELGFDPALAVSAQESTAGTQGRGLMAVTNAVPKLSFRAYRNSGSSDGLQDDYEALGERTALFQVGASAGGAFGLYAHKAQVAEYPKEGESQGLVSLPITAVINDSQSATVKPWCFGVV